MWLGEESRTLHWVTRKLNEIEILTNDAARWNPSKLQHMAARTSYFGEHVYNRHARVPDPSRPLGDITAEIRRTRLREKPEEEWVRLKVPTLISKELWEAANDALRKRGRGRGREGRELEALLRGRLFCPRCGRPMVVRRAGKLKRAYYHCSKYHSPVNAQRCDFRRFIPADWDEVIWNDICTLLRDESWVEAQLNPRVENNEGLERLMRAERSRLAQAKAKMARVREGFEGGIYTMEKARVRIGELERAMSSAEDELGRLERLAHPSRQGAAQISSLKDELRQMRDRNLDEATFEQRTDLIAALGVTVYPSEDITTARIKCRLGGEALRVSAATLKHNSPLESAMTLAAGGAEVTFTPPNSLDSDLGGETMFRICLLAPVLSRKIRVL